MLPFHHKHQELLVPFPCIPAIMLYDNGAALFRRVFSTLQVSAFTTRSPKETVPLYPDVWPVNKVRGEASRPC
jgi:hypothetical protein